MHKLLIVSLSLVLITVLVRSYRLPATFMFAEDQEDLSLRVQKILVDHQPTLISAKFSTLGLYLPPGYLYFLLPFFLLTNFHPSAAIIVVTLLSGLTGIFIFLSGNEAGRMKVGLISWLLYTFWPNLHRWDRIFWNPNLILPATALALLSLIKIHQGKTYWTWLLALALAITLQSHPQGIVLTLLILLYLFTLKKKLKFTSRYWIIVFGILFLSVSPLILFELRHNFVISRALIRSSRFVFRPYYLLFIYPFLFLFLAQFLSRFKIISLIFLSLFLFKNVPAIFNQPDRPDGLQNKIAATRYALDLAVDKNTSAIQFQTSSEGYRYLFWYLNRQPKLSLNFYESWEQVAPPKIILTSPPIQVLYEN